MGLIGAYWANRAYETYEAYKTYESHRPHGLMPDYRFFPVRVISGMSISSIEMPPCWKVSL